MRLAIFVVAGFAWVACAFAQQPVPESPGALEYKRVADALEAVKATPGIAITITKPDGWVIASDDGGKVLWSFTPLGHYAHPAVVRRAIVVRDGGVYVEMRALCQAEKEPCDRLIREFQELNAKMRESIQQRLKQQR